jgi:GTP-binding protein
MDCRHPLRDTDIALLEYCDHRGLAAHILLNKSDKLNRNESINTLRAVQEALKDYKNTLSIQLFSAEKGTGVKELVEVMDGWYEF